MSSVLSLSGWYEKAKEKFMNIKGETIAKNSFPSFLNGFFREIEHKNNCIIPLEIRSLVIDYHHRYLIYGIGKNSYDNWRYMKNKSGPLGSNHHITFKKWKRINVFESLTNNYHNIYSNELSLLIQTSNNELFVAGQNMFGILHHNHNIIIADEYKKCAISAGTVYTQYCIFITTTNNKLYLIRNNNKASLMEVNTNDWLDDNDIIMDIKCGLCCTAFLTKNKNVYFLAWNKNSDLINTMIRPLLIARNIELICVVNRRVILVTNDGKIGTYHNLSALVFSGYREVITFFYEKNIKIINMKHGYGHTLFLSDDNKVYSFGKNEYGEIGNGVCGNALYERRIPYYIDIGDSIINMECGDYHSILQSKRNDLYTFGLNKFNQCSSIIREIQILKPYLFDKCKELGYDYFIETVYAINNITILIVNTFS